MADQGEEEVGDAELLSTQPTLNETGESSTRGALICHTRGWQMAGGGRVSRVLSMHPLTDTCVRFIHFARRPLCAALNGSIDGVHALYTTAVD